MFELTLDFQRDDELFETDDEYVVWHGTEKDNITIAPQRMAEFNDLLQDRWTYYFRLEYYQPRDKEWLRDALVVVFENKSDMLKFKLVYGNDFK